MSLHITYLYLQSSGNSGIVGSKICDSLILRDRLLFPWNILTINISFFTFALGSEILWAANNNTLWNCRLLADTLMALSRQTHCTLVTTKLLLLHDLVILRSKTRIWGRLNISITYLTADVGLFVVPEILKTQYLSEETDKGNRLKKVTDALRTRNTYLWTTCLFCIKNTAHVAELGFLLFLDRY
jgi:hypothetical protein